LSAQFLVFVVAVDFVAAVAEAEAMLLRAADFLPTTSFV